ncbi:hypothetical protein FRC16_009828 [Serendipita sp. 398]|nr:hypothetical protein FRC16_009828 [Serendipita sp. 398]
MSSPTSPRVSLVNSPPSPVRSSSKRSSSSSEPVAAKMLPTPDTTPVNTRAKNRFNVLESPQQQRRASSRIPLKTKSQNVESTASNDDNWRTRRKPSAPQSPAHTSNDHDLLPSPFHSTQRRSKINQNNNANTNPITPTPLKTPVRTRKTMTPLTPGDSPIKLLTSKIAPLRLDTPPKLLDAFELAPASPVSPSRSLFEAPSKPSTRTTATCAACNRVLSSAALLSPCNHLVCSPCLTGCLNAAGENGMDCMACKMPISTFQLTSVVVSATGSTLPVAQSLAASVAAAAKEVASTDMMATAAPTLEAQPINSLRSSPGSDEPCVLRIDNVPWDVTPEMLAEWLGSNSPALCNHALVDRRDGRTLSYAYIEVTIESMKTILRARQNTILGSGKRARAVTVTVSTQDALMREIFPSWKGHFLGIKPSVAGMDNLQISTALRDGLLSPKDIEDVLALLRKPDSHFVKVPTLPYYHLVSILRKFPADKDSKVLHTPSVRNALYEFVHVAAKELHHRRGAIPNSTSVLEALKVAVSDCQVFTQQQRSSLLNVLNQDEEPNVIAPMRYAPLTPKSETKPAYKVTPTADLVDLLATTHNIPAQTVQALAQDLLKRLVAGNEPNGQNPQGAEASGMDLPFAPFAMPL